MRGADEGVEGGHQATVARHHPQNATMPLPAAQRPVALSGFWAELEKGWGAIQR